MAKIVISGMEDKKTAGTTGTTGTTGTGSSGKATASGTEAGNSSQASDTSGSRSGFSSIVSGLLGNKNSTSGTVQNVNENQQKAETSLAELKNKYAQNLQNQYDYSAQKLKEERDEALRENWILQQQEEAALPEQMAAAGINGGASETTLADLKARYQGNRNDIRKGYINNLGELSRQTQNESAAAERNYNEMWLDYLLSLAKMEAQS